MSFSRQDGPKSPGRKDVREHFFLVVQRREKKIRKKKRNENENKREIGERMSRHIQIDLSRPSPPPSTENVACVIEALLQLTRRHFFRFDLNGCRISEIESEAFRDLRLAPLRIELFEIETK